MVLSLPSEQDMSLWADYVTELRGGDVRFIEYEWGFLSYSLKGESVFCEDIYIKPDYRDASHAYKLLGEAEQAGLAAGKTQSVFVVRTDSVDCAKNLKTYLAMGFSPCGAESGSIWLKRELSAKE